VGQKHSCSTKRKVVLDKYITPIYLGINLDFSENDLKEIDDQLKAMELGQSMKKALYFPNEGDHVRVFEVPSHRRALVTKVNRRSLFLYYIDLGYEKVII
jgi:hypothetical protein